MVVEDHDSAGSWFKVQDPNVAGRRVTFSSAMPTQMFVRARKLAPVAGWNTVPYQSDYVAKWNEQEEPRAKAQTGNAHAAAGLGRFPALRHWLKMRLFGGPRAHPSLFQPMSGYLDR
jgi:hypothetical protein